MVYRVRYCITGWIEVEARSADDAVDAASDKTAATLVADTVGQPSYEIDEVEEN